MIRFLAFAVASAYVALVATTSGVLVEPKYRPDGYTSECWYFDGFKKVEHHGWVVFKNCPFIVKLAPM
jgi:hypothetical protein